jgi:hypothetical protein
MRKDLKRFLLAVLAAGWLAQAALAQQSDPYHKVAGDLGVYLGVVPAAIVQGHEPGHPERSMHGGVPPGAHEYHVMVALFETATGRRVTDATVRMRVDRKGPDGKQEKSLEPMVIAGATTFGNYFTLGKPGLYRIEVQVQLPGSTSTKRVNFDYRRP